MIFLTIGKVGRDFLRTYGYNMVAEFTKISEKGESLKIKSAIKIVVGEFLDDKCDEVVVVYPHFDSMIAQTPTIARILPFVASEELNEDKNENNSDIIFEPGKSTVLGDLIPKMLEVKVWQIILESAASEHSARMIAMQNANDNAEDLIADLTLAFNQTRQANITRELAEISAGKMTLEG